MGEGGVAVLSIPVRGGEEFAEEVRRLLIHRGRREGERTLGRLWEVKARLRRLL
jgi:hypothetical protein